MPDAVEKSQILRMGKCPLTFGNSEIDSFSEWFHWRSRSVFSGAAIADYHKFRWLKTTEVYCFITLEARILKLGYGRAMLSLIAEYPSLPLPSFCSCSVWTSFASFQSLPL